MASEDDIERLYAEYAQRLRRYLLLKTRQPELADDLTQECFARLLAASPPQMPDNPLSYLFTIANHLVIDHRRNHNQSRTEQVDDGQLVEVLDTGPGPDLHADAQRRIARLESALAGLPLRTRQVFQLCRLDGMSYQQAAAHLGISTSSVQKHLSLSIEVLSVQLGERP